MSRGFRGLFQTVPDFEEVLSELGLCQGFVVYLYSFARKSQVWRGVKADFVDGGLVRACCRCRGDVLGQYGGDKCGC